MSQLFGPNDSPRSHERGSVEADRMMHSIFRQTVSLHAHTSVAPLKLSAFEKAWPGPAALHAHTSVAPLKPFLRRHHTLHITLSPRSHERGSVEATLDGLSQSVHEPSPRSHERGSVEASWL